MLTRCVTSDNCYTDTCNPAWGSGRFPTRFPHPDTSPKHLFIGQIRPRTFHSSTFHKCSPSHEIFFPSSLCHSLLLSVMDYELIGSLLTRNHTCITHYNVIVALVTEAISIMSYATFKQSWEMETNLGLLQISRPYEAKLNLIVLLFLWFGSR